MNFKKLFTIIPIIALVLLCGSAKDIHDSFDRYYVVVAVKDTTSLNTSYEKPIVRMLRNAGHTVRLAYGDSLTKDNAIGTQDWDTFDLAVIPNFVSCPAVDTTKKIGDIPVIVLEDSLWDDFGFIPSSGASEPYLWIADYQNGRIVKTQWDGNNWSSFNTGASRLPRSVTHYNGVSGQDTSIYYLSFYRSGTACDTLFRTTWNYGSVSKFGKTGGNYAFQFNRPEQIASLRFSSADWIVVADRVNNRYIMSKWQATDSINHWKSYESGGTIFGAGTDGTTIFDAGAGNSHLFKNMMVGSPNSVATGTTSGYMWITNDNVYLSNGQAFGSAKIWKFNKNLVRQDSLTSSKIGVPQAVWFDTLSSYLYWTDSNGNELKRAKFDGTADGALMDSCFSAGSGVSQLNDPRGIAGYSKSLYSLSSLASDDTVNVTTVSDSITSVFTSGYNKIYTSNGDMSGILTDSLDSWNILVKDKSNTYATVVIDTINNQKRIAFGLYDVSKLNMYNNYYGDHAYKSKTLPTGWELFSRSIGRLVEAEKDSIFTVGMLTEGIFYYNLATTTQDSCLNTYFQTNMHRFIPTLSYYGDSSFYNADGYGWETLDLAIVSIESYDYSVTEMKSVLEANNRPLLVLGPGSSNYFFDVTRHNVGGITSITKDSVTSSNAIFDSLGIAVGDSLGLYTTTYPVIPDLGVVTSFTINDNSTVYSPLRVKRNGTYVNIMLISKEAYWVNITSPAAAYNFSLLNFSPIYKDIFEETIYYLLSSKAILPPSNVTATTLSSNSIIVTWTDNSDNETGFNIYLTTGGSYTGEDILVSTVLENATSDTICGLYPPSGLFYLDVGATSTIGGARSGSPDSAYTLPIQPARPIVYALSDTSINVLLNGYLWYDLFNDTTLASNPQWYQPYGKWNVERGYNRLRSWNVLDSTSLLSDIDTKASMSFDGVDDYLFTPERDNGGGLDEVLDVGDNDFAFSFWIYRTGGLGDAQRIFSKRSAANNNVEVYFEVGTNLLHLGLGDGDTLSVATANTELELNKWYHCVVIADRSDSAYWFIDKVYDNAEKISSSTEIQQNTAILSIGAFDSSSQFLDAKLSDLRVYRFGKDGLTISGSHGNSLLFKLNSDTLYSETTGEGLVKYLYDNPSETLDGTDYVELYNANRDECLSQTTFSDTSKWSKAHGRWTEDGWILKDSTASITFPKTYWHSIYQTPSNRADSLVPDTYYSLRYTVLTNTLSKDVGLITEGNGPSVGLDQSYNLPRTVGTHEVIVKTDSDVYTKDITLFIYPDGTATGTLELDNVSLRRVGEVAWWKLDNTFQTETVYNTWNGFDWPDANSDGLADGWNKAGTVTTEIGDGTKGFSGRYQRLIYGASGPYGNDLERPISTAVPESTWYKIDFKYRSPKEVSIGTGDTQNLFPANTGEPTAATAYIRTPAIYDLLYLGINRTYVSGDTFEIDDFTSSKLSYPDVTYDFTSHNIDLRIVGGALASGTNYNTISSQLPNSQDVQWSFKFHFNDSLRLNKQWVKLYFNSSDSVGQGNGYCLYADSSIFRVYKQTSNVYADTLIDTTWTGDYKWHTVDIEQDWQQRPIYKEINYNVYLDNALMGSFSDTTYQTQEWLVLQASHRNQWFDNFWLKNTTPGANDSAYTQYAIIDSISGEYLQTDHTMADTAIWKTWEEWGGSDGFYIKMTPFTAKKLRVVARCKQ